MSNLVDMKQLHEEYDEILDVDGKVPVGGYDFYPSRILLELDPIAYSSGFDDYVDILLQDGVLIEHLGTGDLYYAEQ